VKLGAVETIRRGCEKPAMAQQRRRRQTRTGACRSSAFLIGSPAGSGSDSVEAVGGEKPVSFRTCQRSVASRCPSLESTPEFGPNRPSPRQVFGLMGPPYLPRLPNRLVSAISRLSFPHTAAGQSWLVSRFPFSTPSPASPWIFRIPHSADRRSLLVQRLPIALRQPTAEYDRRSATQCLDFSPPTGCQPISLRNFRLFGPSGV
jgi:hypothetical protein